MDGKLTKADIESAVGSLRCLSKPLAWSCPDHQPVANLSDDGLVYIACQTCGFVCWMDLATYLDLLEDYPPEEDIFKEPAD